MCFWVKDECREHWQQKSVAWKVVWVPRGSAIPVSYWNNNFWYGPGEVKAGAGRFGFVSQDGCSSAGGIYVYKNRADALKEAKHFSVMIVLKVNVDPNDLIGAGLFHGSHVATYKKVTVPEDQPYIEWYD